MWNIKSVLYLLSSILFSFLFYYYIIYVPNKTKTLENANTIRDAITKQVNKSRLFEAVRVNNKLKAEYEISDIFDCDSNCTTSM